MEPQAFQYPALSGHRSIRLLRVWILGGADELHASYELHSLGDSSIEYVAISHTINIVRSLSERCQGHDSLMRKAVQVLVPLMAAKPGSGWAALARLLDRPFFRRIWCFQEYVLSSGCLAVCGKQSIPMDVLGGLVWELMKYDRSMILVPTHQRSSSTPQTPLVEAWAMRTAHQARSPQSLSRMVIACSFFEATDPRDKIFAVQGIATGWKADDFAPDYQSSVEEVYLQFIRTVIDRDNHINLLHYAGVGQARKFTSMPSWVPDWSHFSTSAATWLATPCPSSGYEASAWREHTRFK